MPGHLFEGNPVDEGTTRMGTDTPVHRPPKPQVPHTTQQVACHPVNNSRGKRRSIPAHKTRPDSPLPTMQGAAIGIRNGATKSVMPSNHFILCCPLLHLLSIIPHIRVFSNKSVLCIRWPKCWSFSMSPSNEYSGLTSFRND